MSPENVFLSDSHIPKINLKIRKNKNKCLESAALALN